MKTRSQESMRPNRARRAGAVSGLLTLALLFSCVPCCNRSLSKKPRASLETASIRTVSPSAAPAPKAAANSSVAGAKRPSPPPVGPKLRGSGGPGAVGGKHGVVTSVEEQATRAGVRILEQGGNAVDAAVATAYALAVTHPSAGNIGGGGFMLIRPPGGPSVAIDFREVAPQALTQAYFDTMIREKARGPRAVAVPGSVAGLNLALRRFGKLPLATVLKPAIDLAQNGFSLSERQALVIAWNWPFLRQVPELRRLYAHASGQRKKAGTRIRNPDLAVTLRAIAQQGDAGFYQGTVAESIVSSLKPQGILRLSDLSAYRAKQREPLEFSYRGFTVEAMPPPSAGGVALAQTLLMLEASKAYEQPAGSVQSLHLLIEAARRAHAERRFAVMDPDARTEQQNQALVERWTKGTPWLVSHPIDSQHRTPSKDVHPLFDQAMRELEHTTHLAVVDRDGLAVSCTTTLSASFGAKIVGGASGVVLNNALAAFGTAGDNLPAPGRRTVSSMVPTIVSSGGQTVLVLGSPGGDTIPNTVAQVMRNLVDYGMDLDAAVEAPRVHHGFVPDEVRYERRRPLKPEVLLGLRKLGHRISNKRIDIGDANSILIENGTAWAYADSREGGKALAAKAP